MLTRLDGIVGKKTAIPAGLVICAYLLTGGAGLIDYGDPSNSASPAPDQASAEPPCQDLTLEVKATVHILNLPPEVRMELLDVRRDATMIRVLLDDPNTIYDLRYVTFKVDPPEGGQMTCLLSVDGGIVRFASGNVMPVHVSSGEVLFHIPIRERGTYSAECSASDELATVTAYLAWEMP